MIDLAIIGGGPGGYVAAERAGAKGLNVVLFEKRELGGVCLNEGCIPTKTLLYSAKVYDYAKHGDKYGVSAPGATFDFGKIVERKNKVVKKLVGGVGSAMKANKVRVVRGEAKVKGRSQNGIEIECAGETFYAVNLLLCTGSEAFVPPIPGVKEAGDIIVTNREILDLKEQPKSLVIIGGGVIGMEFASFFNSLGTEVTVVEMLPKILGGLDGEISAMLQDSMPRRVSVQPQLQGDRNPRQRGSLCRQGRADAVGQSDQDPDERRTTRRNGRTRSGKPRHRDEPGSRQGRRQDAHERSERLRRGRHHRVLDAWPIRPAREGEVVVNNLTGRADRMRYNAIPGVVYTNPEVAGVGLTEEQAKAEGIECKIAKLPMAYAGRFVAENEGGAGLCKVIVGAKYGEVLGVHMLGNPCSEIIYGACMAIEQEMTLKEMQEVVFPHPTVSEIFKETVFSFNE